MKYGKRIKTLEQLFEAAINKKAVICKQPWPPLVKPKPAAFIISWQGTLILRAFKYKLYIYKKQE